MADDEPQAFVKWAQVPKVLVQANTNGVRSTMLLKDDGAGFEISKPRGEGHGLANMQARAQRGGGTFTIQSTPGEGSTIKILWRTEIPS